VNSEPIKVLCVDDNPDLTRLLATRIGFQDDMRCIGCVHDLDQLDAVVRQTRPDVVVLDLTMIGRDALEHLPAMTAACPGARTLIYSGFDHGAAIDRARDAGVWGYVSKSADMDVLIGAIRAVATGRPVFPSGA